MFQSPIGTNKTKLPLKRIIFYHVVSIPHRYKQNEFELVKLSDEGRASIPYRYKQNPSRIASKNFNKGESQSPIGTNKTLI